MCANRSRSSKGAGRAQSRKSAAHALGRSRAHSARRRALLAEESGRKSADVKHAISTVLREFLRPHYARGTVDHDLLKHIRSRAVNQVHRIIIYNSFYIASTETFTLVRKLHTCTTFDEFMYEYMTSYRGIISLRVHILSLFCLIFSQWFIVCMHFCFYRGVRKGGSDTDKSRDAESGPAQKQLIDDFVQSYASWQLSIPS